ncbi:MAG TPA: sigma 54-interacting transcriptional regulator [Candidatus Acidoferrum sp.]|nr:sigma 54-interacting transcriptional regulator [Candidatus Acidoferrum sp.]
MALSSQKYAFDNRLLAVEELLRQRQYGAAQKELGLINDAEFENSEHESGLLLALRSEAHGWAGQYAKAIDCGLRAAKILADFPLNQRYGRIQLVLSKAYSALGDLRNAEIRARDALAAFRRGSDSIGQVDSLNELARVAFIRCDYKSASTFLEDALGMAGDNQRKSSQLTGNLARVRLLLGQWPQAESDFQTVLQYDEGHHEDLSMALNLLSLGYLNLRRREFVLAAREYGRALAIIEKLDLKREKIIYLEYAGELALEKGDNFKAKALLSEAYQQGRLLAPESSLVSQASRRLAEVDLALDNVDEAMKYGQKALELARQLGEKSEVGLAMRVIARVFAARSENDDAFEYMRQAIDTLREVGDPYDLARTLVISAEMSMIAGLETPDRVRSLLDEAGRTFKKLRLEYWIAETDYRFGMFACQQGDLALGFRKLSRAEKLYAALDDKGKVKAVNQFLHSLTDQAVALSISSENEFKLFGNLVSQTEIKEITSGKIEEILDMLMGKTNAARALLFAPDFETHPIIASFEMSGHQMERFAASFGRLLGEEIATNRPTLLLDCRRDPYINELHADRPEMVASVIVVPFQSSGGSTGYVYLDKLSVDNTLNPFNQAELNFAVGFSDILSLKLAELQKMKLLEDNRRLKAQLQEQAAFPNIITRNHQLLQMLAQVRQIVDSPISISIEGETGSGKDLVARAIHYNSVRRNKRFISVNCAALPETLLESELFGYKRGAFTGADRDKTGLFEEADGGTFFLDEVADMPLSIQAKVLRVLEEKEIVRLGETVTRKVDVRIISATNKDLKQQMATGLFRQDLYYRLSALTFRLPPLRERKEDIPLLVEHFLQDSNKSVTPEVLHRLIAYDWPGNIRELENEMRKLVLLAGDSAQIGAEILSGKLLVGEVSGTVSAVAAPADDITFDSRYSLYDYLASWERKFIIKALKDQRGIKKHAAAALNIPESTLRLKIKQYDIDLDRLDLLN